MAATLTVLAGDDKIMKWKIVPSDEVTVLHVHPLRETLFTARGTDVIPAETDAGKRVINTDNTNTNKGYIEFTLTGVKVTDTGEFKYQSGSTDPQLVLKLAVYGKANVFAGDDKILTWKIYPSVDEVKVMHPSGERLFTARGTAVTPVDTDAGNRVTNTANTNTNTGHIEFTLREVKVTDAGEYKYHSGFTHQQLGLELEVYVASISKVRFDSERYLVGKKNNESVLAIVISNWTAFKDSDGQAKLNNDRSKSDTIQVIRTLKDTFRNIKIKELANKCKKDLKEELKTIANSLANEKSPDVMMCFIIGQGKDYDHFYEIPENREDKNAKKIFIKDILRFFNGEQCPALVLRPKLFFVQIDWKIDPPTGGDFGAHGLQKTKLETFPIESDFFVYTYKSADSATTGISKYTEILCEELKKKGDLLDLTLSVNRRMYEFTESEAQIPLCVCQLTKNMIFPQ